jgi:hypothetical protein
VKGPWYKLAYDRDGACWVAHMKEGSFTIRCGECFQIRVGDRGIPCRLELDRDWYVIMSEAKFNLRKKDIYLINYV